MNEEMFKAIIELVRSGGSAAVWIAVLHYVVITIQIVLAYGLGFWVLRKIYDIIKNGINWGHKDSEGGSPK